MTVATIDHPSDQTVAEGLDRTIVDVAAWLDHSATLRRSFTADYVPRHRADGPAV
jgi:hypothetical protein